MLGEERLAVRVRPGRIEFAEQPAEGNQLRIGELLATEAEHEVIEPSLADFGEGPPRQGSRQVDAGYFRTKGVSELLDLDRRHAVYLCRAAPNKWSLFLII